MKKALVALALAGFASTASAAVAGSYHDLSTAGPWASLNGQLSSCQFCHAPHNVNNTGIWAGAAPLWNRNTPTTTFSMYTSATLRNPRAATPNANSMTCLSCHDGATDMGATYVGARGFTSTTLITATGISRGNVGADLTNDHPVSVRYAAGATYAAVNAVTAAGLRLYTYPSGADYVECASCHDPHNQGSGSTAPFLRVSKTVMCTTCHLY